MSQRIKHILSALLLVIFVNYFCETTFFIHTHIQQSGSVTHSHPYSKSASHTHSATSFDAIALLSEYISDDDFLSITVSPLITEAVEIVFEKNERIILRSNTTASLRAPPHIL